MLPFEHSVRLFLQHEDNVARLAVGLLIAHAREADLLLVVHARLDVHLENLALLLLLHRVAAAVAVGALLLDLLHHPRTELAQADDGAAAVARAALLGLADDLVAADGQLGGLALVQIFQRDLERVLHVLPLARSRGLAAATAAAEERREDVVGVPAAALLQALESVLVVLLALLRVLEHLVRCLDLLELLRVAALVRVLLEGQLAVSLFDLRRGRRLGHPEVLVQLGGVGGLARTTAHTPHPRVPPHPFIERHATEKHGALF
mmetsp:Transcript_26054/g.45912  ORF Transcript_26054/g.45912 Transcript_26054/m.45912 type:complete len:263 (-) Transcript_26054:21-809(-)